MYIGIISNFHNDCSVAIRSHGHELCLRDRYGVTSGGLVVPANQLLPATAAVCVRHVNKSCKIFFLSDIRKIKLKCGNQLMWVCPEGMFECVFFYNKRDEELGRAAYNLPTIRHGLISQSKL